MLGAAGNRRGAPHAPTRTVPAPLFPEILKSLSSVELHT